MPLPGLFYSHICEQSEKNCGWRRKKNNSNCQECWMDLMLSKLMDALEMLETRRRMIADEENKE